MTPIIENAPQYGTELNSFAVLGQRSAILVQLLSLLQHTWFISPVDGQVSAGILNQGNKNLNIVAVITTLFSSFVI